MTSLEASRGEVAHRWPSFLPDGHHFFYTVEGPEGGIYVGALDRSTQKRIVREGRVGRYSATGVYPLSARAKVDGAALRPALVWTQGEPTPLVDGMGLGSMTGSGFWCHVMERSSIARPNPTPHSSSGTDGMAAAWRLPGSPDLFVRLPYRRVDSRWRFLGGIPRPAPWDIYTLDLSTGSCPHRQPHGVLTGIRDGRRTNERCCSRRIGQVGCAFSRRISRRARKIPC